MYRLAICEDDPEELDNMIKMTGEILAEEGIPCSISGYSDTESLENAFTGEHFDLLILDIEMEKGRNGMEFAKSLRSWGNRASIIFATGSEAFLREGYSVQPIHYLLKPVSRENLAQAIGIDRKLNHSSSQITLRSGARLITLNIKNIYYIEGAGHSTYIYEKEGQRELPFNIKKLMEYLPREIFCRCHNSYLVNLSHVTEVVRGNILLSNGTKVPVGRYYYSETQQALIRYLNQNSAWKAGEV